MHDLHEIVYTTQLELQQRTAKYLEKTDKVYKPSKTIEFDRGGELLLFSCDNVKNSTIYLKYPYIMYDMTIPMAWYIFFVNPLMWKWQTTCAILYGTHAFSWLPHVFYWKNIERKIHRLYLLRGGKYVRIWTMNPLGDRFYSWANINEFHLLTEDYQNYQEPADDGDFMTKEGQLKYEVQVELENYVEHGTPVHDEIIYLMKEGTVHEPEILEQVVKGYNIDTSDFTINTEHNTRHMEPTHNY